MHVERSLRRGNLMFGHRCQTRVRLGVIGVIDRHRHAHQGRRRHSNHVQPPVTPRSIDPYHCHNLSWWFVCHLTLWLHRPRLLSSTSQDLAKLERETHEKMRKLAEVRSAVAAERQITEEVRYAYRLLVLCSQTQHSSGPLLYYEQTTSDINIVNGTWAHNEFVK